ncbi:MAG: hypothetical protein AB1631_06915 [Acidobacteriota bacterium]
MDHRYIDENNIGDLYLMGKLSAHERALFEMHFINCERCVEMLEEISSLRQAIRSDWPQELRETASPPIQAIARPAWPMVVMACLASLLVVAAVISLIQMRRISREIEETKALLAAQREPQNAAETAAPTDRPATAPESSPTERRADSSSKSKNDDSRLQINTPVFMLAAERRGEADSNEIVTDDSQKWLLISLDLEGDAQYQTYRATIRREGRFFRHAGDLKPNRYNAITISFRSDALPPGQYLLLLEGVSKTGEIEPVANYPFRALKKSMK